MSNFNPAKLDTLEEHPSEEDMEVHPAIQLLIARMESHPEEFYRWNPDPRASPTNTALNNAKTNVLCAQAIEHTKSLWNRKEKRLYNLVLRKVRLAEVHSRLMRALLETP